MMSQDNREKKLAARYHSGKNVMGVHQVIPMGEHLFLQGDKAPQVKPFGLLDIDMQNVDINSFPLQRHHLLLNKDTVLRVLSRRIHVRDDQNLHRAPLYGFI